MYCAEWCSKWRLESHLEWHPKWRLEWHPEWRLEWHPEWRPELCLEWRPEWYKWLFWWLYTNLAFSFRHMGHCPIISHYYTLKAQQLLFIDKEQCLGMERALKLETNLGTLMIWKLSHCTFASLQSFKEKQSRQRTA